MVLVLLLLDAAKAVGPPVKMYGKMVLAIGEEMADVESFET